MAYDFESEWRAAYPQVWRYCRSLAHDPQLADEAAAETGRRAWRGFPQFRGDCTFLTWVMGIARREVVRRLARKTPERSLTDASGNTLDPPAPPPRPDTPGWLARAVADAVAEGGLTPEEGVVLTAAAGAHRPDWAEVAARLGWTPGRCAVVRFRAIPRLRVYLFLYRPQYLGGAAAIAQAFDDALKYGGEHGPLTPEQARAFRRMVLEGDRAYTAAGWRSHLSAACEVVVRFLDAAPESF